MRRTRRRLLIALFAVALGLVALLVWAQRDNAYRVSRAQNIVRNLQRLEIDRSDLSVADAIAKEFGSAPLPEGWTEYPKEYCNSPKRDKNCWQMLVMNNSPLETLFLKYRWLPRLGLRDWFGYADVIFRDGTVSQYRYWVWYKASNGQWRAAGAGLGKMLPKYEEFQARISDSYSIERRGMTHGGKGIVLETSLTRNATENERQRASHIDFSCLAEKEGCGEICEIMPEAWLDFYERQGRLDVERLGSDYLLCSKAPKQSTGR